MKKAILTALLLALALSIALPAALAANERIENIEYEGYGILKLEFYNDCDWYEASVIRITDAAGNELPYLILGGEDEECYLRAEALEEGAEYTLSYTLGSTSQEIAFKAGPGVEYKVGANGNVRIDKEKDDCDFCRSHEHDEDFCPERIGSDPLPEDADELARLFRIDRCERCGGIGHEDDRCPNR